MTAERDNEKAESRNESVFIAVAKARVWASEGWQVVVTAGNGKTFTPAEFEELCSLDAKSLAARKSPHVAMESADEQHGDSQELDEKHDDPQESDSQELDSQELQGAGEERIGHPLLADTGAGTVPADEADVVAERKKFFRDRRDQGGVTPAGDVAAADRTIEKY